MNDTDVDARLAENGRRWRDERPAGPALADVLADLSVSPTGSAAERQPRRTRFGVFAGRRLVALAAVAVVVAAVVLVGVVIRNQRGDGPRPATLPAAHPGDVSYHGITLTVPATWKVGPALCSAPTVDAVVPDTGEAANCPSVHQPKIVGTNTLVYLAPRTDVSDEVVRIPTSRTTVSGAAALRGRGTDGRGTTLRRAVTVLVIPSVGVVVEIAAVNPAVADAILATVRITPVDRYGCRGVVSSVTPTGDPTSATLVPGRPTSGHICEYQGPAFTGGSRSLNLPPADGLVGSAELTLRQLDELTRTLRTFGGRTLVGPDPLRTQSPPYLWFVLRYSDGTTQTIATTVDHSPVLAYDGHWVYYGNSNVTLPTPFDR